MDLSSGDARPPEPGLESAILAVRSGDAAARDVVRLFARWPMLVPSTTDTGTGAAFDPVILDSGGRPMIAVFTSPDRMSSVAEVAPFWATYPGLAVLQALKHGVGVVVNAGSDLGMELAPDGIADIVADLESTEGQESPDVGEPLTVLELAIISHAAGSTTFAEALSVFVESDVFVPSSTVPTQFMNEISPVSFTQRDRPYVAVYSRPEFIREPVTQGANYVVQLPAGNFSRVIGNGAGIVVNPGTAFAFLLEAEVLAALSS